MHILYEVSRGTAPMRIIVHVRDMARLCVFVIWLCSAIVLRFNVLRILLEQQLQNGCLGNSAV